MKLTFGKPANVIKGALLCSGMYDLHPVSLSKRSAFVAFDEESLERLSPIRHLERINVPVLLMHGGGDRQVNPTHTLNLATRLDALGKDYQVHIFGRDDHLISRHRAERDQQVITWFKKHLQ